MERERRVVLHGELERTLRKVTANIDSHLYEKRQRLRTLLEAEADHYIKEWDLISTTEAKLQEEEEARRLLELNTRAERERLETVQQKLLQLKIENCEQARPYFVQKNLEQLKKDQKWQILEKVAQKEEKDEEEKMFHDLMLKTVKNLTAIEEENQKRVWLKKKENMANYLQQSHWKTKQEVEKGEEKFQDQERIRMDLKLSEEAKQKELEAKKEKTKKTAEELQDCLAREIELRKQKQQEEAILDQQLLIAAQKKIQDDKAKAEEKKVKFQRDMMVFLEHSKGIKDQKSAEERKLEEVIVQWRNEQEKKKEEESIKLKAAKKELQFSVMQGRQFQLQEKIEKTNAEKAEFAEKVQQVHDEVAHIRKLEQEEMQKAFEEKRAYGLYLQQQMKRNQEKKQREKMEDEEYLKSILSKQEEIAKEVAEVSGIPFVGETHPMRATTLMNATTNYLYPLPCPK